jgi:hypothetical protein
LVFDTYCPFSTEIIRGFCPHFLLMPLNFFPFIRAEELETALMEMVKQDNRRQLSAKVRHLSVCPILSGWLLLDPWLWQIWSLIIVLYDAQICQNWCFLIIFVCYAVIHNIALSIFCIFYIFLVYLPFAKHRPALSRIQISLSWL